MKKQLFKISSAAAVMAMIIAGTGCNKIKDFGTTNVNPAVTGTPVTAALLTNVESGLGANYATTVRSGQYAQYFSETQYPDASLYTAPILSFAGTYSGDLEDLQNIIQQNTDASTKGIVASSGANANQIAVARILKAYIFWQLTDRWGDIPYSESLKGSANKQPKFDKQSDIYVDLIKELKEANAQFDNAGAVFKGDILMNYAASTSAATVNTKWKKFANSLRMLIALRASKVYPSAGQWSATEFAAALNDANGYIAANTDNVVQTYPNATFANPYYTMYVGGRVDNAESKTMTDLLSATNDPRIANYGTTVNGFPYGLDRPHATLITTGIALLFKGLTSPATDPITILPASVVTFARAEAAQRGWTTEVAAVLYAKAIELSFTQNGYTVGQAATFVAQPSVALSVVPATALGQIATQRWVATYPDGNQAWAEWRRTGFPVLTPAAYAVNPGGQIPRRYIYGTDEYSLNKASVTAAAALITGGDTQDGRVWWDK